MCIFFIQIQIHTDNMYICNALFNILYFIYIYIYNIHIYQEVYIK